MPASTGMELRQLLEGGDAQKSRDDAPTLYEHFRTRPDKIKPAAKTIQELMDSSPTDLVWLASGLLFDTDSHLSQEFG